MIISALSNYYDILVRDENVDIALSGFCRAKVSFEFVIDADGVLKGILPLEDILNDGKKERRVAKNLIVPQQEKRANAIVSNFLCDNAGYVIGLYNPKEDEKKNEQQIEDSKAKAPQRFDSFKALHNLILGSVESRYAYLFLKYLNEFSFEKYADIIEPMKESFIKTGGQIVFRVDGCYLHEVDEIKTAWLCYLEERFEKCIRMQCAVSGKISPIANLHPSIKGVKDAQSVGASIVSFNADSYESYGKEQGLNAPVSEGVTFKYTTALNYLLSARDHRMQIGDATTVFWAESSKKDYTDFLSFLMNPSIEKEETGEEEKNEKEDRFVAYETETKIKALLDAYKSGKRIDFEQYGLDQNTKTYILGLSPNAARLSVRFFYMDSFAGIIEKLARHYADLAIEKNFENQPDNIPTWLLVRETVNPKSKNSVNPLLAGALARAIVSGGTYPRLLFSSIINRIRCDREVNYIRVSIIKAFLIRNARNQKNEIMKEVLYMSLNETTNHTAYLLGRLFAVLEKAQKDVNPGLNATIRDRYFSSACATPASVFPTLLKLAQSHISKSDYGAAYDKRISEILNKLDGISLPAHLCLEDQGVFIIGYYQQNNAFYKKVDQNDIKQ